MAALNARALDIQAYVNAGGGIVALSEDGFRQPATAGPQPIDFAFLPFVVSAAALSQGESGFTVTPFGSSLGITAADVNGNFSHSVFTSIGPFQVVDRDAAGQIVTIALSGSLPEPSALVMSIAGLIGVCVRRSDRKEEGVVCQRPFSWACLMPASHRVYVGGLIFGWLYNWLATRNEAEAKQR